VKILLKDKSVTDPTATPSSLVVPGCGSDCSFEKFKQALSEVTPSDDFDKECAALKSGKSR